MKAYIRYILPSVNTEEMYDYNLYILPGMVLERGSALELQDSCVMCVCVCDFYGFRTVSKMHGY